MSESATSDLAGQRVIVTGAAMGIGRATAERLALAGADVLLTDIDAARLELAVESMPTGGGVASIVADISDPEAPEMIVAKCTQELGPVDILVNNAGIYPLYFFGEYTAEAFDHIFSVNLRGAILMAQAAGQSMVERGGPGAIVNMSAVGGRIPFAPGLLIYLASKYALLSVTRSLALELAPYKIRVNSVSPGPVETDGTQNDPTKLTDIERQRRETMQAGVTMPWGRMGEAAEVADSVLFLVSDASRFITGSDLVVDGGRMLV